MIALWLLLATAGNSSCTAPQRPPAPVFDRPTAAFQLLEEHPPAGPLAAVDYFVPAPTSQSLNIVDEQGNVIGSVMRTRSEAAEYGAAIAEAEGDRTIAYWRIDENGNVVMPAHVDLKERAVSVFEPPLVIAFSELQPNEPRTSESDMRVLDLRNPARVREMGRATRTMEYVGDQRVRTPAGEFTAKRIEVHFLADLRMADADERTTLLIVPGLGVVAEDTRTNLKILGAFGRADRRTVVLSESAE